ncbi:MAG: phage major capsid protein [Acidobacteria bacterium]|nr:phage major capsid protein [Acidobacteriota bacterium]
MSDYKALIQQKADLVKAQRGLLEKAKKEEREFSDEELTNFNANITKLESLEKAIERETKVRDYERSMKTVPDWNEDPDETKQKAKVKEPEKFASFGQFIRAVYRAGVGLERDARLQVVASTGDILAAASGLNESIPAEGGFLVQQDFVPEIIKGMNDVGQILQRVRRRPITVGNGVKQNAVDESSRATGSRWGGVRTYWLAEAGALTSSMPKFRQIDLRLEKCASLYYATEEELQDAEGLSDVLTQAFSEEISFTVEDAIWRGDGAGKPLGIMHASNLALVSVAKETSQAADTIKSQNVLKMWSRFPARSQTSASSVWLVNVDVVPQLFPLVYEVKNVAGTENVGGFAAPIFVPPSNGGFGMLLGKPVIPVEYAETLGDKGDILLADLSQYLLIEKGLRSDSSLHVRFLNDEQTFRIIYRVNGQPIWSKALTPYKGANTLSPFVTLDARA